MEKIKEVKPKNKLDIIKKIKTLPEINMSNAIKILIVEDEEVLAKVFEEKFRHEHFDVKLVYDGEEVFNIAKSYMPSIVVLDLMLPKKSGIDVLRELKGDSNTSTIPVIVVSNLSDDTNIKTALKLGAKDFFVKSEHPINEIIEKIKSLII